MRPSLLPIDLLPSVLRVHSLSEREIILPWPEVQRAVMILTASNVAVTRVRRFCRANVLRR